MKHIVQLFLVMCLGLNLLAPSLAFVVDSKNQQLICSTDRQLWTNQKDSQAEFIETGLALGFSLEQINEFGDASTLVIGVENTYGSTFSSGHCPLCVFEDDSTGIIGSGYFAYTIVSHQSVRQDVLDYSPLTPYYLRPPNKAPPLLFVV